MTREEFDKLYLDKAVHCDTEEKANHFLALADSVGYKWLSGRSLIEENMWETYEEETCYLVIKDEFMFCSIDFYKIECIEIIEYQPQPKFKEGDKVRVKDASYTRTNGKVGVVESVSSSSPMLYYVRIDDDDIHEIRCIYETQLEKVEEITDKEETIDDIIEEIEYHQKAISVLHNKLKMKAKVK